MKVLLYAVFKDLEADRVVAARLDYYSVNFAGRRLTLDLDIFENARSSFGPRRELFVPSKLNSAVPKR